MNISVITPSLPSRWQTLGEACWSVAAQEHTPVEHLIGVDYNRDGSASVRNRLANAAAGDWLAFLDDDDLLDRNHLRALAAHTDDADIVYGRCRVIGRPGWNPVQPFDGDRLRQQNYIPVTVLMRASVFRELDGFRNSRDVPFGFEDWDLWLRALDAGARFRFVDAETWTYRLGATSKTMVGEVQAA